MNDLKAKQQEIVELRLESKSLAKDITERNAKIKNLDAKIEESHKELIRCKEEIAHEQKSQKEQQEAIIQREKAVQDKETDWEVSLRQKEKEKRDLEKSIKKLNESNINALVELDTLKDKISEASKVLAKLELLHTKVAEYQEKDLVLSQAINLKKEELTEVETRMQGVLRTSEAHLNKNKQEVEALKAEKERLNVYLHNLSVEILKQKNDIAIYISRAQVVYQRAFPELEMKL